MGTWRKMFTQVSEQGQVELVPGNWFSQVFYYSSQGRKRVLSDLNNNNNFITHIFIFALFIGSSQPN